MRTRTALTLATFVALSTLAGAQDVKTNPPLTEVKLTGSLDDLTLLETAPPLGVVVSEKGWQVLAKAWGIKDTPKVDFGKTLLVVATTRGSLLKLTPRVVDGDLKLVAGSSTDLRPGFRYAIEPIAREGVKTVSGQPLPKE